MYSEHVRSMGFIIVIDYVNGCMTTDKYPIKDFDQDWAWGLSVGDFLSIKNLGKLLVKGIFIHNSDIINIRCRRVYK